MGDIHLRAGVLAGANGANPLRVGTNHGRKKVRAVWRQGYVPESVSSHFCPLLGIIPYTRAIRKPKRQKARVTGVPEPKAEDTVRTIYWTSATTLFWKTTFISL